MPEPAGQGQGNQGNQGNDPGNGNDPNPQGGQGTPDPQGGQGTPDPDADVLRQAQNPDAVKTALQRERDAAAKAKKEADDLRKELQKHEDKDKSELEKAQTKASNAEREAQAATLKSLQYEAAAAAKLPLSWATRLNGENEEELKADAEKLAKEIGAGGDSPPNGNGGFDGGARQPANTGSMDDVIRAAAGRTRVG